MEITTVVDPDGILRYASPAFGRTLGYDPEEAVGVMNVFDHVHPEDLQRVLDEVEKALSGEGVTTNVVEYRFMHKDGTWRWMQCVGIYFLDDPHVRGVVVSALDVTEVKEAGEALNALRREYEELVGSVEAIIWKGEAQTLRFTFVSDHAEAILGYPAQRWTQEPSFWPDHIHPDDREWAVSFCRKAVAEKKDHDFEYRMISADGDVVWLRDIVRVGVEDGVPTQLFGVMVDITGRKVAEEAIGRLGRSQRTYPRLRRRRDLRSGPRGQDYLRQPGGGGPDRVRCRGANRQGPARGHTPFPCPDGTPYPSDECPIHAAIGDGKVRRVDNEVFWRKDGSELPRRVHEHPDTGGWRASRARW